MKCVVKKMERSDEMRKYMPLLVLFAICWTIQGISIAIMKDMEYKPMPGQYGYEYGYNENSKL